MIVDKAFDEYVIEHLGLTTFFGSLGWEPLLHIFGFYYPHLTCEFS